MISRSKSQSASSTTYKKDLPGGFLQRDFAFLGTRGEQGDALLESPVSGAVMGLDLSLTSTGIEVLDSLGRRVYGGTVGVELSEDASTKDRIERLVTIANFIVGKVKEHGVAFVGIEGLAFGKKFGGEHLAELHGVVKTQILLACHLVAESIPPTTARRVVFGKGFGRIKKALVDPLLRERGIEIDDPDQRDAYVVARCVIWRVAHGTGNQRSVRKRKRRRRHRVRRDKRG